MVSVRPGSAAGFCGHFQAHVGERQVADDPMVVLLDAGSVVGELSTRSDDFRKRWGAHNVRHEVVELLVMRVAPASVRRMATQMSAAPSQSG